MSRAFLASSNMAENWIALQSTRKNPKHTREKNNEKKSSIKSVKMMNSNGLKTK